MARGQPGPPPPARPPNHADTLSHMPRDHSSTITGRALRSRTGAAALSRCPHSLRGRHDATGSIAARGGLRGRTPRCSYHDALLDPYGLYRAFKTSFEAGARRKCVLGQDGRSHHVRLRRACAKLCDVFVFTKN